MNKCECYHEKTVTKPLTDFEIGFNYGKTGEYITSKTYTQGICWGVKYTEECTCGGDQSKCDFYESKRKKQG